MGVYPARPLTLFRWNVTAGLIQLEELAMLGQRAACWV